MFVVWLLYMKKFWFLDLLSLSVPCIGISTTMYNIIIRNNGLNGFYKGFYFPLITNGTINALVYGVYGSVLR